ncbi:hypothetical protein DSO57_1010329 [Entomophthora muscae]|uniref:Uncharacterized protein n=1 Tax=Entomophthora muscae TaxID=34485 RepID=A0ACC2THK2_9FUNG|nr:hypothetical protein DSO57_1010329 [Entomophthora muscae]
MLLSVLYSVLSVSVAAHVGTATYTNGPDSWAKCSLPEGSFGRWASVGPAIYGGSQICGACIKVTNKDNNETTLAHVIDQCISCGPDDIVLNLSAFGTIGHPNLGRLSVEWEVIRCPAVLGNITYVWQKGSNKWYSAFQIRNHAEAIATVEYSASLAGPWVKFNRRDDNYFISSGLLEKPAFVKVTSISGKTVIDKDFAPMENAGMMTGSGQL